MKKIREKNAPIGRAIWVSDFDETVLGVFYLSPFKLEKLGDPLKTPLLIGVEKLERTALPILYS